MQYSTCDLSFKSTIFCQKKQSILNFFKKAIICFWEKNNFQGFQDIQYSILDLPKTTKTSKNLYLCSQSDIYITIADLCDGINDCPLNEDEKNCTHIHLKGFKCDSRKTSINYFKICDHNYDCIDKSDEKICGIYEKNKFFQIMFSFKFDFYLEIKTCFNNQS